MIKFARLLFCFLPLVSYSQTYTGDHERYPLFEECKQVDFQSEKSCFESELRKRILSNFKLPETVIEDGFEGAMVVLFEVTREGAFRVVYIDAAYPELKEEMEKVFQELPDIAPATYNSRPIAIQFRMPVQIPLDSSDLTNTSFESLEKVPGEEAVSIETKEEETLPVTEEYAHIESLPFDHPRLTSQINIPLSKEWYSRFEDEVNQVGTNFHTASRPFTFSEVQPYYDFEEEMRDLQKPASSWLARKLWNEHLIRFQGEDYWFTVDFALDLQVGKDFGSDLDVTYNNTRAAVFQGGLGKNLNFYSVVYENQGRFADYFNQYAESIRPDGGDPAIIPGRGIAKDFMGQAYDYPVAEGYLSFTPSDFINLQLGHGKHFIGDGYRSLFLSDNATPYPYFRINTNFWKIKYTNTWMSLRDVRSEVTGDGSFRTKYMANHFLSFNATEKLNLGFFESVMWENDNNRGFDMNYLNPVIFYRAIEFSTGARAGNAIMGISGKYKWSDHFMSYAQWIIDEFSSSDVFGGKGSWKNKHGFQLGTQYFNAFGVQNLHLLLEYNQVRPYTYSHNTITLNYGHNNQSMAHLWGANFRELVAVARYKRGRWFGTFKTVYGQRGLDFNSRGDFANYGGSIYRSEEERPFDLGIEIGQGNTTDTFFSQVQLGYILNPATNLKFFGSFLFRNFQPEVNTVRHYDQTTYWINFGLRTDLFNWYYDF